MQHAIIGSTNIHSRNIQKPNLSPYNSLRLPPLNKALKLKEKKIHNNYFLCFIFSKTELKQHIAEKITDSALFALVTKLLKNKRKKKKKKDRNISQTSKKY